MNKAAYIEALSRASDRSGHLLVALMDKYNAANLQEITAAQAKDFYELCVRTGEIPQVQCCTLSNVG